VYGRRSGLGFGFGPPLTPAIRTLLAANITVFILQLLLRSSGGYTWFNHFFGLVPADVWSLPLPHLWQPVTYMFLHGGFWHITLNMFVLWMFGAELEQLWGQREFLRYYFVTGIGAATVYLLLMPLIDPLTAYIPLIGASGACYGLLMAYGMIYPDRTVLLYFLIPVKVKYFVIGVMLLELLATPGASSIGHLAHLGGLLFGFLYLKWGQRWWLQWRRRRRAGRAGFRTVGNRGSRSGGGNGGFRDDGGDGGAVPRTRIDRILEKISREGLDSLTAEEQEILRRASRH